MHKRLIIVTVAVALGLSASTALAQCGCGSYLPAAGYTTYYAPTATYYPPVPYATYYAPAPCGTCYAPAAPRVTYYVQPYAAYYGPAPCATCYGPAVGYYGVAGRSVFGAPRVYVPGQPVRNVFRAITP